MEYYVSDCPDCGAHYTWTGYKTGIGKTPEQLEQMRRDRTTCQKCGGKNLNTGLDHESPDAQAFDQSLADVLARIFGIKEDNQNA